MTGPGILYLGEEEAEAVGEVLRSRQVSRYRFDNSKSSEPSRTQQFEMEMADFLEVKHCLGMNSCTSALLSVFHALGIGPGDEVLVPGYTFVATIAAVIHSGATPVLCEIDESLTLDWQDARQRITHRTKAIVAVHMLGAPCNMDALSRLADEHGLSLIEDAAQACGALYNGKRVGGIGKAGVFSLNIFKTITAGDGGVLATSDSDLFERAFAFHDHGNAPYRRSVTDRHLAFGLNLRMHEMTGAVALEQLRKLAGILENLKTKKALLLNALGTLPGLKRRVLNDPQGDSGTVVVLIFEARQIASGVAERLAIHPLIDSGKHYYGNMTELCERSCWPFGRCPDNLHQRYSRGTLPRTDDILSRSIALSVGVRDTYLGTGFGIDPTFTKEDIERTAHIFREKCHTAIHGHKK